MNEWVLALASYSNNLKCGYKAFKNIVNTPLIDLW